MPSAVGGTTAQARSKLARRSATNRAPIAAGAKRLDHLVAIEEEHVVRGVDDALLHQTVAHGEHEATEHADVQLVDVEGVVLGEREAVPRRFVELVELGHLLRVVSQLLPQPAHELLAADDTLLVEGLRILALVEVDHRGDAGQGDRRVLAPGDVGQVVDGVVPPSELEQVVVELGAEGPSLVSGVERGEHLARFHRGEHLAQGRAGLRRAAERPEAAAGVDGARVEPLQGLVRLGRHVRLDHLVVEVAERAARQQDEVDVAVDPPLVPHPVRELVELGDHLLVAEGGVVGGLERDVRGDDLGLPLLLPRLADAGHLLGQLVVVGDHPPLDLRLIGDRVESDVEEVVDLLRRDHDRAVVLCLRLREPLRQRTHDEVERQRRDGPRCVHLVEGPEPLDLVRRREHDLIGRRRHVETPRLWFFAPDGRPAAERYQLGQHIRLPDAGIA